VNRNKKSIGLSFQKPEGVKILHELARTSDVLVENYIPGRLLLMLVLVMWLGVGYLRMQEC
jgi:crotonobetainyl-CoA:carnitine CoA-transferase CaiB-like acyl-CoA transferase